tara:strand:- start:342 stop:530 length:189 start_codon:yes stop_codon:yes gene_type:complete
MEASEHIMDMVEDIVAKWRNEASHLRDSVHESALMLTPNLCQINRASQLEVCANELERDILL